MFHSHLYMHIREPISHHAHTCIWKELSYIYLLLRGNSTSYIHLGSMLVPSWHGYIFFWKASYATIYIFRNALFTIYSLCKVFLCHISTYFATYFYAMYIYTCIYTLLKNISHLLRCIVPIMGQPKFLQASPYFHAFLILKPNLGFLAISMLPCIEIKNLGS